MGVVSIFGLNRFFSGKKNEHLASDEQKTDSISSNVQDPIPSTIEECDKHLKAIFKDSSDIIIQSFKTQKGLALVVYVDGLVDKDLVDRDAIAPLKSTNFNGDISLTLKTHYHEIYDIQSAINEVLQGDTAIFYSNSKTAYIVDFKKWDKRSVETPDSETVVRGPREGFTESIRTNTAMLRRKIRTPKLIIENMTIGRQTNTPVSVVYMEGIVNLSVLKELRLRLSKIDTDAILESGYIEQYISENIFSPVTGIGLTQKPDVLAARILEGRVAVMCDGTPYVLTIPELFIENIQTSEDYYNSVILSSILRLLRVLGVAASVLLPGLSVAIITYNQEMMPSPFLASLITATLNTPLPAGAEVFLLMVMFELVKEAGTRLPKAVGSAITIVGSLIVGDAAVTAGIVGAPAVIIVALTAVTGFIAPTLTKFLLVYRFIFLLLGGTLGLVGIGCGITLLLTQLISTTSFGVPILDSFSKSEMKDSMIRFPLRDMFFRPPSISKRNQRRFRK